MRADERLSALLLPVMYGMMGRPYQAMTRELQQNETLAEEALAALQWKRLTTLLHHCYLHVPYYRAMFDELGAHPDDIRTMADYARLPILDKEMLKSHSTSLVASTHDPGRMHRVTTGGSTGTPVQMYYDSRYFDWGWATLLRNISWTGHHPGERQAWVTRESTGGLPRALRLAIERKWVAGVVVQTPDTVAQWASHLARQQPRLVYSTPSSRLPALASYLLEHDIHLDSVRAVMTSSETLLDETRLLIEEAFGAQVFDQYGSTECLSIASECASGSMHVNADVNLVEYVPLDSAPDLSELVITPLFNYGMPLLRYRLKDLGRMLPGRCDCGRTLPRMGRLVGRLTGTATLSDGTVLTPYALEELVQGVPGIARFQFRQTSQDAFDLLVVRAPHDQSGLDAALGDIGRKFSEQNGPSVDFRVCYVDDIPLTSSGKHLYVVALQDETPQ